jgi:hypothetical protein
MSWDAEICNAIHSWRKIAITLIDPKKGEQTAQARCNRLFATVRLECLSLRLARDQPFMVQAALKWSIRENRRIGEARCETLIYDLFVQVSITTTVRGAQHEPGFSHWK